MTERPITPDNKTSKPHTEERRVFGNTIARFIGRSDSFGTRGLSLQGLNSQDEFDLPDRVHVKRFLVDFSKETGIKTFRAPIAFPRHNGRLKVDTTWKEEYNLDENGEVKIYKGENFEGCEIKPGEAFIFSPADCLTLIVKDESGRTFAMHAGRDSVFDAEDPGRANIVQNIISAYGPQVDVSKLMIWTGFGVGVGPHFDHPEEENKYAELNRFRREYLQGTFSDSCYKVMDGKPYIDLQQTIKNMAAASGIPEENITNDTSFTTESPNAYSNRGGDKARNLVAVYSAPAN